jgi:hypothetical protein
MLGRSWLARCEELTGHYEAVLGGSRPAEPAADRNQVGVMAGVGA